MLTRAECYSECYAKNETGVNGYMKYKVAPRTPVTAVVAIVIFSCYHSDAI